MLGRHDYFSYLDGYSSPKDNARRAKELGLNAINISNHGNVSSHIVHYNECKKIGVKPILGTELYCCYSPAYQKTDRYNTHMVMWAKNKTGLYNLWKLITQSTTQEYFYYKPRIQLENFTDEKGKVWFGIEEFVKDGNCQAFSGHMGSHCSSNLFADLFGDPEKREKDISLAYNSKKGIKDIEYYKKFLRPNWLESTCELAIRIEKLFGKGNFFIELQNELDENDKIPLYIHPLIVNCLREVSKQTGIPACASSDPHYARKIDAQDQLVMVCTNLKENIDTVNASLEDQESDTFVFFGSTNFYIHSFEEMSLKFTEAELEQTNKIADMVEDYDLKEKLQMPKFEIPKFDETGSFIKRITNRSDRYLMYLCIQGAKKKQPWLICKKDKNEYWQRLLSETSIISQVGLSDYFLIFHDICQAADNRPLDHSFDWQKNLKDSGKIDYIARGVGRGSAAGCLISYLLDITQIDPLRYNLLFSRFYNPGRINKDNISPMDIDEDVESAGRDWIIEYIKNKYGHENVSNIIVFSRTKAKAAIKDVFRFKNVPNYFDIANAVTSTMESEASIIDEIQTEIDAGDKDYNVIQWSLDNSPDFLEYYEKYKDIIDQASRIESTVRSKSKHPSGICMMPKPVKECFPLDWDTKSKEQIIAFDMRDIEKTAIKLDILGISLLDKLKRTQDLVNARKSS